jgi:hypothetical protein
MIHRHLFLSLCESRGMRAVWREFTKTAQRLSSETPLSVTHRPEALRHRLAPGLPLNEAK